MLKKQTKSLFQNYLNADQLDSPLMFQDSGIVSFHWANDKLTSSYVKELYKNDDGDVKERFEDLKLTLEKLKNFPVWLMSKRGQIKSDLHNLYQCYLDPRLKTNWFHMEEILVSMNHEAGPFSSIKSMRWFDKDIYAQFIYVKMLESWVPQRNFRLSLDIPLEIRAGGSPFHTISAKIHQISSHGLVLHLASCSQAKQWSTEDIIFLKKNMPLENERGIENCLKSQEWMNSIENFTMKGDDFQMIIHQGLDGQGDKDNFLFIPFDKINMLSLKAHDQCMKNLKSLFDETESTIHKYVNAA